MQTAAVTLIVQGMVIAAAKNRTARLLCLCQLGPFCEGPLHSIQLFGNYECVNGWLFGSMNNR